MRFVVGAHPPHPSELHLAAQPSQTNILLSQPVLIALFLAADVDAVSLQIVLPCMEHAGHAFRVARRLAVEEAPGGAPPDEHPAVRAHVTNLAHSDAPTAPPTVRPSPHLVAP